MLPRSPSARNERRRREPWDLILGDRGSAALEFIAVGTILLVPVAYLVVALGVVQDQLLGVQSAARHTARLVSTAAGAEEAQERADRVMATAVVEYGMDPEAVQVFVTCIPAGASCPSAGATVIVTVGTRVALPLIPPFLGGDLPTGIPIEASAAYKVSRTWGSG